MDLMEYQGKQYFARFGIPVSAGGIADTVDEAVAQAEQIGYPVVVKAQVMTGGRGKAGGIKLANDAPKCAFTPPTSWAWISADTSCAACGSSAPRTSPRAPRALKRTARLKTKSFTPPSPLIAAPKKYLGMLSVEGGVEIESVPDELIAKIHVDPILGLSEEACRDWIAAANLPEAAREGALQVLMALYRCYTEGDCELAEINPLILTTDGQVRALDAKVTLDDAAHERHPNGRSSRRSRWRRAIAARRSPKRKGCSTSAWMARSASSLTARAWRCPQLISSSRSRGARQLPRYRRRRQR